MWRYRHSIYSDGNNRLTISTTDESSVNAGINQGSYFGNECSQGNTCTNEGDNLVNIAADANDTIQANIEQNLHKKIIVQEQIQLAVLRLQLQ
jgi:hypothetical protein